MYILFCPFSARFIAQSGEASGRHKVCDRHTFSWGFKVHGRLLIISGLSLFLLMILVPKTNPPKTMFIIHPDFGEKCDDCSVSQSQNQC